MRFTKMQGAGNDYVYVNCFQEPVPADPAKVSIAVSDRHFGIGSDGMILICPSEVADAKMRMFNADGSESEMCGNGLRCVAKYVYDHGIARKPELALETGRGILHVKLDVQNDKAVRATIDMGEPILKSEMIPTTLPGDPPINHPLEVGGRTLHVTCVSMGNPHCISFVEELDDALVHGIGPLVEKHSVFPRRVNAEFIRINSRTDATMRVWERGSGETLACGTGACAVCVAGVLTGKMDRKITIHLLGGDLELHWSEADNHVYMTGPAVEVFSGEWPSE
ncbi:diaminopimelate epimerase [Tuwongella immobilis]|uniref:Diaminopimelate epimerase n=1 Tax=Tuwongella immobilis TaxID=692036 RepID=A0A6C2YML5_9BACT|nr:diaminopimelate epimerase [Tuwongella immobilis]VIP02607.1 diaminopimelate epimerase : Diaminopimelate epimerase OS=Planctomyces brasiliensis (strain ATCC 49424 / DSM 5305 / JCM 21570 / NBRC 103401 / IFAM 1448) GN=dapF PE=3 SV=1: DAP_epimerase: DAP_epimerase [Tuwongella immobilis]VTS01909.1 diaminopimelate epimerase : Diaminopimelate epimerase OS=Planctomyces brasiliensis (strain ATCC 49424 / DSM 5305 / JCM 21570 / NBRC 103401 / IFAM 1448) GN=dapF PE=3 SV=1: DAP_epimerase: DAP_epimerase [Tuwon